MLKTIFKNLFVGIIVVSICLLFIFGYMWLIKYHPKYMVGFLLLLIAYVIGWIINNEIKD